MKGDRIDSIVSAMPKAGEAIMPTSRVYMLFELNSERYNVMWARLDFE